MDHARLQDALVLTLVDGAIPPVRAERGSRRADKAS